SARGEATRGDALGDRGQVRAHRVRLPAAEQHCDGVRRGDLEGENEPRVAPRPLDARPGGAPRGAGGPPPPPGAAAPRRPPAAPPPGAAWDPGRAHDAGPEHAGARPIMGSGLKMDAAEP